MAKDREIPAAANVLGTIGTVLWCIQLVPQIWHNWRQKKTDGLPAMMMLLWALSGVPFGSVNIPLQLQPQILTALSLVSWGQILYYNHNYTKVKAILVCLTTAGVFAGVEVLLILTLRIPYNNGVTWPGLAIGIIASILLTLGLVSPYQELWKRNGRVIGINWVFLSMDTGGALFSVFALGNVAPLSPK
ncbi:hypothetical protein FQN57_003909 [Myotisia sp. PD_48]|nr:hypothetical protein FQN57_003909 [Myotisia sp. PD_48]